MVARDEARRRRVRVARHALRAQEWRRVRVPRAHRAATGKYGSVDLSGDLFIIIISAETLLVETYLIK